MSVLALLMALGALILLVTSILTPRRRPSPISTIGRDRPALPPAVAIPTAWRKRKTTSNGAP